MTQPQILIHEMSFNLPTGNTLLTQFNLALTKQKIGLVGKNGMGKSTLIKLITGELTPTSGAIHIVGKVASIPQEWSPGQQSGLTAGRLLGFEAKLKALARIEQGSVDMNDYHILNDDWLIKEKWQAALRMFDLHLSADAPLCSLSGGELTRLLLTRVFLSKADFLLLDEPTNHLDNDACKKLYKAITQWQGGLIIASHDRTLLNLMDEILELSSLGVTSYGGNYTAYQEQKRALTQAKQKQLVEAKQFLAKTQQSIQTTKEKHEQRQAQGKRLRKRGDQPKILLDAMENRSTASKGSLLIRHNRMLTVAQEKMRLAKEQVEMNEELRITLPKTRVPNGKIILEMENVSFAYSKSTIPLISNFNLKLQGPERIALCGNNGSGKTTLIKLILNQLAPIQGHIYLGTDRIHYLDQHAKQLAPDLSILENFLKLNPDTTENEAYQALALFLFRNDAARKMVNALSGGEKLRAALACILQSSQPPQLLILDEPTNHLDLNSMLTIESTLKQYEGAMIVIAHDQAFLEAINIARKVYAPFTSTD